MPRSKLVLGGFTFKDFEVPEKITGLGGTQKLVTHEYVGPDKDVQVLGAKPDKITWSGFFLHREATERARILDQMRISGEKIRLSWDVFAYEVIIERFTFDPENIHRIPYSIQLEVVRDLTAVPEKPRTASVDEGVINAFNRADTSIMSLGTDNTNFMHYPLPNQLELPEDEETVLAYIKDPITLDPPTPPTTVVGTIG